MLVHDDIAVIEPKRGKHEESLPLSGVLVFTPQDLELILHSFSEPARRSHRLYLADAYIAALQGGRIAVVGPSLGAPQTILILEKLIALGMRNIFALGWCGSLQPHVAIGDVVLPVGTLSEEGTSAHYPLDGVQVGPAAELLMPLKDALMEDSLTVHEGCIWTTDAPYRETVNKVLTYKEAGILAVEMETSALFTVACYRRIKLAAALVVSDELHSLNWVHGFKSDRLKCSREKLAKAILAAMDSVNRSLG